MRWVVSVVMLIAMQGIASADAADDLVIAGQAAGPNHIGAVNLSANDRARSDQFSISPESPV